MDNQVLTQFSPKGDLVSRGANLNNLILCFFPLLFHSFFYSNCSDSDTFSYPDHLWSYILSAKKGENIWGAHLDS